MHATSASDALPPATLLQLIWLASPALPVGGFSYSEGLESAIETGQVTSEATLAAWLQDQLHLTQARGDLPVVARALAAWRSSDLPEVVRLNNWVLQTRESSELQLQTGQMGRSLAQWLRNQHADEPNILVQVDALAALPPTYPVAFALAAAHGGASAQQVLLAFGFGWAENMVQAALKAMPLGQSAGQRVLAALAHTLPGAVDHALGLPDDERQSFSPMLAILCAQHETQYSRLFRS